MISLLRKLNEENWSELGCFKSIDELRIALVDNNNLDLSADVKNLDSILNELDFSANEVYVQNQFTDAIYSYEEALKEEINNLTNSNLIETIKLSSDISSENLNVNDILEIISIEQEKFKKRLLASNYVLDPKRKLVVFKETNKISKNDIRVILISNNNYIWDGNEISNEYEFEWNKFELDI